MNTEEQSFHPIKPSIQAKPITWYRDSETGLGSTPPDSDNPEWMTLQDFVYQLERQLSKKDED